MKKAAKLLTVGAALTVAAVGAIAYRKYQNSYEYIPEDTEEALEGAEDEPVMEINEETDFEPVSMIDDGFDYFVEDPEQILFYE